MHLITFLLLISFSCSLSAQTPSSIDILKKMIKTPTDVYTAQNRMNNNKTLQAIKLALNEKDRHTLTVLVLDFNLGLMGALGNYQNKGDTWVLTPEIAHDIALHPSPRGHEMVVIGYDDHAIATDNKGHQHKGLFTLRPAGDLKEQDVKKYYMAYDYFKVLIMDAQRIRSLPADGGVDSVKV